MDNYDPTRWNRKGSNQPPHGESDEPPKDETSFLFDDNPQMYILLFSLHIPYLD